MAADSEPKKTQEPQLKEGEALAIVKNQHGGLSTRIRGSNGAFVKKEKPLPPVADFVRARRKAMLRKRPNTDLTEHQALFKELLTLAHAPVEKDLKTGLPDAKMVMAKLKAMELLLQYTEGKPMASELEKKNETTQPVKTVVVYAPDLMNPTVVDGDSRENEKKNRNEKPTFIIDAEFTDNK
jgi:hypothetical protein